MNKHLFTFFIAFSSFFFNGNAEPFIYVTTTDTGRVIVIDKALNEIVDEILIEEGASLRCIVLSPDDTRGYVANSTAETLAIIDLEENSLLTEIPLSEPPFGVAITPDGNFVALGTFSDVVSIVDLSDNSVTDITIPTGPIFSPQVDIDDNGEFAYFTTQLFLFAEFAEIDLSVPSYVQSVTLTMTEAAGITWEDNGMGGQVLVSNGASFSQIISTTLPTFMQETIDTEEQGRNFFSALSPDQSTLFVTGDGEIMGELGIYLSEVNLSDESVTNFPEFISDNFGQDIAVHSDGGFLAYAFSGNDAAQRGVRIVNLPIGSGFVDVPTEARVFGVAISKDPVLPKEGGIPQTIIFLIRTP